MLSSRARCSAQLSPFSVSRSADARETATAGEDNDQQGEGRQEVSSRRRQVRADEAALLGVTSPSSLW